MTDYDVYVFLLCLVVYVMLTALSVFCITVIARLSLRLVRGGLEDDRILSDHRKEQMQTENKKKLARFGRIADYAFSGVVCLLFATLFISSFVISCTDDAQAATRSAFRVVQTGSMAMKNEKNTYLEQNGLDDQIQTFDLIRTEALPDEMELALYDIVVYEVDGYLIVHRIVGIEEPNEKHPDCRHFLLQGDAVDAPDRFPVLYSQMRAVYRGFRVPFIGSFVMFMQSPAGWLCMILIIVAMIAAPMLDKMMDKARKERLAILVPDTEGLNGNA